MSSFSPNHSLSSIPLFLLFNIYVHSIVHLERKKMLNYIFKIQILRKKWEHKIPDKKYSKIKNHYTIL